MNNLYSVPRSILRGQEKGKASTGWASSKEKTVVQLANKFFLLHGPSPRANYTDRATAACRRSDCQLLQIEGATWSG
jgi:hypothetical protein